MTRGILIFAYNTRQVDYVKMAAITAARAQQFLSLPVTVVTTETSLLSTSADTTVFDQIIRVEIPKQRKNYLQRQEWNNKGRHEAYELSPYEDTIVLDADYVINSGYLLTLFADDHDIKIHDKILYLMTNGREEFIGYRSKLTTLWATVIRFRKTQRAQQFFAQLRVIENNYNHFSKIFGFLDYTFRNDYAATIALKTVNGHVTVPEDRILSPLVHIPETAVVERIADAEYKIYYTDYLKTRVEYILVRDQDFHLMNKDNFLEMFDA